MKTPYYQTGLPPTPRYVEMHALANDGVRQFYRDHHQGYTMDKARELLDGPFGLRWKTMDPWEAVLWQAEYVDPSDPNAQFTQIGHSLQVMLGIVRAKLPRAAQFIGLFHDVPKICATNGVPHHFNVGDTFALGMPFSSSNLFPEYFEGNSDIHNPEFHKTPLGIYKAGCGLGNVMITPGHDEYGFRILHHRMKTGQMATKLPKWALWMMRYHSLYSLFKEHDPALMLLMNRVDMKLFAWVVAMLEHDYYTKDAAKIPQLGDTPPELEGQSCEQYAKALVLEFLGTAPLQL